MRLCLALGKTLYQISTEMSSDELVYWLAYNNYISPLPDPWRQTGVLASTVANFSGNITKPVCTEDFIPMVRVKRKVSWQEQRSKMLAASRAAKR